MTVIWRRRTCPIRTARAASATSTCARCTRRATARCGCPPTPAGSIAAIRSRESSPSSITIPPILVHSAPKASTASAQDASGNLWVGTQNGLNRLDANGREFTRFIHQRDNSASLANNYVFPLHVGPSKRLWIGTVGGGIDRWDEATGSFEHFPLSKFADGTADYDVIYALHETVRRTGLGRYARWAWWCSIRFARRRRAIRLSHRCPTASSRSSPLSTRTGKGRLWISTIEHGVLILDPATGRSMRRARRCAGRAGQSAGAAAVPERSRRPTTPSSSGSWGSGVYSAPLEEPQFCSLSRLGARHRAAAPET